MTFTQSPPVKSASVKHVSDLDGRLRGGLAGVSCVLLPSR